MDRRRKPAMRAGGGSTRADGRVWDHEQEDPERYAQVGGWRILRRTWALIRWAALIVGVGVGAAFLIAIVVGALATLIDSSL